MPPQPQPSDRNNISCDVLIIGAGVIGCSIARHLAKSTLTIAVVEAQNDVSMGASKANSGIVHGGYDEQHGTLKSRLAHRGNQMFHQLNAELHFGFRVTGSLVVAFEEEEEESHLHRLLENGMRNGVSGLRIIGTEELRRLEPNLNPAARKALHCPHTGICSPYEYTIALAENAAVNGVEFYLNHKVVAIKQLVGGEQKQRRQHWDRRFSVQCDTTQSTRRTFEASIVINCAGLFADQISRMIDNDTAKTDFRIVPRKGDYLLLDKVQGELVERVLFPVPSAVRGKGILVSETYWGNLLIGPTSRPANDGATNEQVLKQIITSARRLVPSIDVRHIITSYSGQRAKSDRGDFIIDFHPAAAAANSCFINVAGIDSPGLTSSPAVAVYVEELLIAKGLSLNARPRHQFNPIRPPIIVSKAPGFRGTLTDDGDPARYVICRCERITQAEIIDGLHRPLAVKPSLTAIKRRTRAGMGQCQGKFCEQRVVDVIKRELGVDHVDGLEPGSSLLPHRRVDSNDADGLAKLADSSSINYDENNDDKSKL